jgi:hypothetical protein
LEEKGKIGIGECGILRTLSIDDRPDYEAKLQWVCQNIHLGKDQLWDALLEFPSIQFGVEMAFLSLQSKTPFDLFPSDFTTGKKNMLINGLVWMGEEHFMKTQIEEKLAQGFSCIKLKIGAIDFEKELGLLRFIRQNFDANTIEIRVDANGAFDSNEALSKLNQLNEFELPSADVERVKAEIEEVLGIDASLAIPVSAKTGELGIIPGSMGAKSFIVKGKGNPESFCSCSHGAGRKHSRNAAKKLFSVEDHIEATRGVECRKDSNVIDETPAAYKDIEAVMKSQEDLVDIVYTLKQILCVKG